MQNGCLLPIATQPFLLLPACCFKLVGGLHPRHLYSTWDNRILLYTMELLYQLCHAYIVLYKCKYKSTKCHSATIPKFNIV